MKTGKERRAVLLDLDGTLLDTNYLHTVAWWRALEDAGQRRPMAEIHRLIGMGGAELLETLLGQDDPDIKAAHGHYFSGLHPLIAPLPGAAQFVQEIKSQGGLAVVVTSATKDNLPVLLAALGVGDLIDLVVDGEDADRAKPHPDLFAMALQRTDVSAADCLALGDAVWDVQAAARVGVACVAVKTGGFSEGELRAAGAVAVYQSCADLLAHWSASPLADFLSQRD
ncbi:MAG TPA: HAD family hydrolase [Acidimicrobiales bacterium]|jgi:HAD superfamily hydrolase (TIGR01509 family)|nr:HAD family hydrolase [Acidimicrobiales bacterium]